MNGKNTLKFGIPESGIRNPESGIRNPESGFRIPDSGFRIPGFRVALYCLQEKRGGRPPLKRAKQESDSESGRQSQSEREKDGYLAFNQLGHWTLVEGRNNFCCKGKFNMLSVFVVAVVGGDTALKGQ